MLTESFVHVPEIGAERERVLWAAGFKTWWDVYSAAESDLPSGIPRGFLKEILEQSIDAYLAGNWHKLGGMLSKSGVQWRVLQVHSDGSLAPETRFRPRVLALDIETEGISKSENSVTAVGVCGDATGFAPMILLPHRPGFVEQLFGVMEETDLLLTFNGTQFDIPFLLAQRGLERMPRPAFHVDLRFLLAALGLRGGLKRVQVQMGYHREGALADVDGYMAVLLWQEHLRNTHGALDTLVRYCLEDVVVLLDMAPMAYNLMSRQVGRPWVAPPGPGVSLEDFPYVPALIHKLSERIARRQFR